LAGFVVVAVGVDDGVLADELLELLLLLPQAAMDSAATAMQGTTK
jgi:hypothetical protein